MHGAVLEQGNAFHKDDEEDPEMHPQALDLDLDMR